MYAGKDEKLGISVECEKPDRRALDCAAEMADVVFYSKLWAEVWLLTTENLRIYANEV